MSIRSFTDRIILLAKRAVNHRALFSMSHKGDHNLLSILQNNPKQFDRVKFLARLFATEGYELRIAGGAVRDIILGVPPQDIDFATTALPEQSLEILKRHEDILRIIVTAAGQRHGTVAVKFKETNLSLKKIKLTPNTDDNKKVSSNQKPEYDHESPYEITTLRCDKITDGRHAKVEFINDWKQDAERRDLTINAMFLTLEDGKLIDYFDGQSDLLNGVVRFVGDPEVRIKEDYLRILRYFRFWSRYGMKRKPDADTSMKITNNLDGFDNISPERIWREFKKIYEHYPYSPVTELMLDLGVPDKLGFKIKKESRSDVLKEFNEVEKRVEQYRNSFKENSAILDQEISAAIAKIKEMLPLVVIATLLRSMDVCLDQYVKLKFSNLERDVMLYITHKREDPPTQDDLKCQIFMAPQSIRPTLVVKIIGFLIYQGRFEELDKLQSWIIPEFPMSGMIQL